jgi:outer membrane protein
MLKKTLAAGFIAALAIFTVPTTASAAPYSDTGAGTAIVNPGELGSLTFCGFQPGESTTASAPDAVALATDNPIAGTDGCVTYTASATRAGSYTITVTSASSVSIGVLTITPVDSAAGNGTSAGGSGGSTGAGASGSANADGSNAGGSHAAGSNGGGTLPNTGLAAPMLIGTGAAALAVLALGGLLMASRRRA